MGMCQEKSNLTKKQITADGHQSVFNASRKYRTRRRASADP